MQESNIFFATNTYNYGGEYSGPPKNKFNESKGNMAFFRQVMDYDALKKLKSHPKMGGTMNSKYYVAHISQVQVLDPNFMSVMLGSRRIDPLTEEDNKSKDKEYGYPAKNNYYPLLDEIIIDEKEFSYADEMLGKWVQSKQGQEESSQDPIGLYIKQKSNEDETPNFLNENDIEIDDSDPYYYLYEESAGATKKSIGNIDKAKLYESQYGSIFHIFEEVPQEEIIQAPLQQYSFVNAGPGTGKTYTLLKKIQYMINSLEADPEGILVLCFTNAAVNEIKARVQKYAKEEDNRTFINVDIRTFHSFSWLLISQANDIFSDRPEYHYIDISKLNYDQSIRSAIKIIKQFGDEVFGGVEHLIVDEIQDLTNERASLVLAMVQECKKSNTGITVLGDSCQGIYDYSDDSNTFVVKSDRFYKSIFSEFYESGKFYKMEKNHRQSDKLINLTTILRQKILDEKKVQIREAISKIKQNVPAVMSRKISVYMSQRQFDKLAQNGTICLMCRNNAQVLSTSSNLRKRGIKHIVNAYNEFEYYSDWIGKVFGNFPKDNVKYEDFVKILKSVSKEINPYEVWERLQEVIGSKNNVLKIIDILSVVGKSKVDDPIFRNVPKGNLIVSNIHKSKGREYDTVIVEEAFVNHLINDTKQIKSTSQYLEEAKILYVAITRPKKNLYFNFLASADVSFKILKTGRKRWVRGNGKFLKTIEIRALSDASITSFNTLPIQNYIIKKVNLGDEINLVMDTTARITTYNIIHISESGEKIIGQVSQQFIDDIDAIVSPYKSPWPKRITEIYVSGVHSQISDDYKSTWCWVDFCGLGNALSDAY